MISDESSSDSETGRFKSSSHKERSDKNQSHTSRDVKRSFDRDRSHRDIERKRHTERSHFQRSNERHEVRGRSRSRDRKPKVSDRNYSEKKKKSPIWFDSPERRKSRERSKDKSSHSKRHYSRQNEYDSKNQDKKREDVNKSSSQYKHRDYNKSDDKKVGSAITDIKSSQKHSHQRSRSVSKSKVVYSSHEKSRSRSIQKSESELELSDMEPIPGSYYRMVPVADKDVATVESVTDSSDEEQLRAKLLKLEKRLDKTKKKKHKHKKSKKEDKKSDICDMQIPAEVSSTTDVIVMKPNDDEELPEVTSTQKPSKDSSEEGEVSSGNESVPTPPDPNDLRHRLKYGKTSDKDSQLSKVAGPALPPHMRNEDGPKTEGPSLPKPVNTKRYGPTLSSDLRQALADASEDPKNFTCESDDDGIGPLPQGSEEKWTSAHIKLEERALEIKIKSIEGGSIRSAEVKSREEWMLELPDAKVKHLGLGPRQFRAREGPDMSDRSSWTDTPEQKAHKAAGTQAPKDPAEELALEAKARQIASRDAEQEKAAKKHKKKHKREESLQDLHQKKIKKKKKKDDKGEASNERRPFDRNIDLQANKFDEAQKRSIIKKAQNLDSRFSRGEAKYL